MDKIIKLTDNPLFQAFIGDRGLRVYKTEVNYRLGMPGLTKLVEKVTGDAPNLTDAYVFCVKGQNTVKILSKDQRGTNMVSVYDEHAEGIKKEFIELGLMV